MSGYFIEAAHSATSRVANSALSRHIYAPASWREVERASVFRKLFTSRLFVVLVFSRQRQVVKLRAITIIQCTDFFVRLRVGALWHSPHCALCTVLSCAGWCGERVVSICIYTPRFKKLFPVGRGGGRGGGGRAACGRD